MKSLFIFTIDFLLLLIALVLIFLTSIVNFFHVEKKTGYFRNTALSLDKFAGREFRTLWNRYLITPEGHKFGNDEESMSEVLGYNILSETLLPKGKALVKILTEEHCLNAID